jgi:hypothetical protein
VTASKQRTEGGRTERKEKTGYARYAQRGSGQGEEETVCYETGNEVDVERTHGYLCIRLQRKGGE